jgi:hypothetical protein
LCDLDSDADADTDTDAEYDELVLILAILVGSITLAFVNHGLALSPQTHLNL